MLDWSCKAKNQMKQKAHTSVLWLMLSFRKHNSRLKGSCNGFPSSLLWSIGLSANHSLMNALKTLQKAGIFFKSRVLDLTSLEEHKGEFNSSCRKFSKSGLGLESCPGTQLYKWIRPVCRLTCKRWWHFRGIYRRNCQFTPLNSSLVLDSYSPTMKQHALHYQERSKVTLLNLNHCDLTQWTSTCPSFIDMASAHMHSYQQRVSHLNNFHLHFCSPSYPFPHQYPRRKTNQTLFFSPKYNNYKSS